MEKINGATFKLLDELEDIIDNAGNIPLSRKVAVDKEELLEIIKDIKIGLPNQFKQAEWVNNEKQKILDDAQKDADSLLVRTQTFVDEKVKESEITKLAQENANKTLQLANATAEEIKIGAKAYAIEMLGKLHSNIEKINKVIEENIKELEEYNG